MDILGIGGAELIAILILMLVVAGPKRMIEWAYVLGQYVAKLRSMWKDVMAVVQQEVNQAGLDIKVPTEMPTRSSVNRSINQAFTTFTRPVQETLDEVRADLQPRPTPVARPAEATPAPVQPAVGFGTWSPSDDGTR